MGFEAGLDGKYRHKRNSIPGPPSSQFIISRIYVPVFNWDYKAQKVTVYCPSRYCSHDWGNSHLYCYVLRYFQRIISTEDSISPRRDSLPLFREKTSSNLILLFRSVE